MAVTSAGALRGAAALTKGERTRHDLRGLSELHGPVEARGGRARPEVCGGGGSLRDSPGDSCGRRFLSLSERVLLPGALGRDRALRGPRGHLHVICICSFACDLHTVNFAAVEEPGY